jgi:arginase
MTKKAILIDGRFGLGQTKPGVELAFYELHRRGLLKKLKSPYEMVLTMDSGKTSSEKWKDESQWLEKLSHMVSVNYMDTNKVVTVGGDHSIALSTITGIIRKNPTTRILYSDAHADFNTSESSLTGNLHGMPLNGLVNGWKGISPLFQWIGEGIIKPSQVAIIGLRDVDPEEQIMLDSSGIPYWTMKTIRKNGLDSCLQEVDKTINPNDEFDWHVSFDLDSIDPIEFPSTGCLVPGGITFDEALTIMRWFNKKDLLKSFDVVEWNAEIASTSDCDEKLIRLINEGL